MKAFHSPSGVQVDARISSPPSGTSAPPRRAVAGPRVAFPVAAGVCLGVALASQRWPIVEAGIIDLPIPGWESCGDANSDGRVDIADPVFLLKYLFLGGPDPICPREPQPEALPDLRNVTYVVQEFDVTLGTMVAAVEASLGKGDTETASEVLASLELTTLLLPEEALPNELKIALLKESDRVTTMFELPIAAGRAVPIKDRACSLRTGRCDIVSEGSICFERRIRGKWNCLSGR